MEEQGLKRKWLRALGLFSVIIADLMGCTAVGVALGYFVWTQFHAPLWVVFVLSVMGFILGMYRVYKVSQREL